MTEKTIFDAETDTVRSDWTIINDKVMGGKSESRVSLEPNGNLIFSGHISLENNGGFASLRYHPGSVRLEEVDTVSVRLKGDGKRYQFRLRENLEDYHSYVSYFETTGDWQNITLPLRKLYPTYRGRTLDQPDFSGSQLEEVGFLIGNNKEECFRLEIKSIGLQ